MSSFFRASPSTGSSAPRTPRPPSAFRQGNIVASSSSTSLGVHSNSTSSRNSSNRLSRNFEQDLLNGDTVLISQGVDESKLGTISTPVRGADDSFSSITSTNHSLAPKRRPSNTLQPATPKVVPPTPTITPVTSPANMNVNGNGSVTSSSSTSPSPPEQEGEELDQTKRRSLFRSPGTASSPDLATLVRKARERGAANQAGSKDTVVPQFQINEAPTTAASSSSVGSSSHLASSSSNFLSAQGSGSRLRAISSTSSFSILSSGNGERASNSPKKTPRKEGKAETLLGVNSKYGISNHSEVGFQVTGGKNGKSSVRAKTSAFFNKFMHQGSVRDKQRANSMTAPNTPSGVSPNYPYDRTTPPPVPPLPSSTSKAASSTSPKHNDVFSSPSSRGSSDITKPLPRMRHSPSNLSMGSEEEVKKSLFAKDYAPVAPSKEPTPRPRTSSSSSAAIIAGRRRSMSVGDVDITKAFAPVLSHHFERDHPDSPLGNWDLEMQDVINRSFSGSFNGLAPSPRKEGARPHTARDRVLSNLVSKADQTRLKEAADGRPSISSVSSSPTNPLRTPARNSTSVLISTPDSIQSIRLVSPPRRASVPPTTADDDLHRVPSTSSTTPSSDVFLTPPSSANASETFVLPITSDLMGPSPRQASGSSQLTFNSSLTVSSSTPSELLPSQMVSPRSTSLRLPTRSPNPFGSSLSVQSRDQLTTSPSPNPRVTTLRSHGRSINTRPASATIVGPTSPRVSVEPRGSREYMRSRVQPRAAASASEPMLVGGHPPTSGRLSASMAEDGSRGDPRTVRLVSSSTSMLERGSSSRPSPPISLSSQTDVSLMRKPSHSHTMDPEELDSKAKELAAKCWAEDETFLGKEKIAEWLGGTDPIKTKALKYYLNYFDFTGLRLDNAFRHLCGKLYLKGETQQVDRILDVFSNRFWECNPSVIYGGPDVVHSISYSLLLLNTDLHIAEISTRMTRSQFVRNTFSVIQPQMKSLDSAASEPVEVEEDEPVTSTDHADGSNSTSSTVRNRSKRSGSAASWKSLTHHQSQSAVNVIAPSESPNASRVSLNLPMSPMRRGSNPASLGGKAWEAEMENLLRDMYNAIKHQQILQPITANERASTSSLAPGSALMRRGSQRSFNAPPDRLSNLKRGSIRGIQTLLGGQSPYGSNSSSSVIDGRISPSPSFATSIGDGVSASSSTLFTPTLGFASNLSHSIIKESQEDDLRSLASADTASTNVSISDEELALLGAPWAKEGMLSRKQYWESSKRRAKSKTWMDVFVVIQRGELSMFTFGEGSATGGAPGGASVGGGNWLSNAQAVGEFTLSHSLAHGLPPPGYNRQRPHCFVLTLSTGAVYFFQAGTEDLVNEWVSTCNYWAARQSKEPLSGGVSNMEYGWSRILDAFGHTVDPSDAAEEYEAEGVEQPSDTFSVRSGRSAKLSKRSWADGPHSMRMGYSAPGSADRLHINDWKPPLPPAVASTQDEETQLESLQKQVVRLKKDLKQHNELRVPMLNLYQPRSANAAKALSNWEQRSQYLLAEIIKYESYVESLRQAMSLRLKKRGEKVLERALVHTPNENDEDDEDVFFGGGGQSSLRPSGTVKNSFRERAETIEEAEEPSTPGPLSGFNIPKGHMRESAEVGDDDDDYPQP